VALKYPELLRTVVAGELLLAPVPPPVPGEDQAAVAAVERDNEKISWFTRNPEDSAKAILTFVAKH
jgi:hypothetical protein